MEDVSQQNHYHRTSSEEPCPKKRCIRFTSDQSSEDPTLITDSGFGDLSSVENSINSNCIEEIENGDENDLSNLPPDNNIIIEDCKYRQELSSSQRSNNNLSSSNCEDPPQCCSNSSSSSSSSSSNSSRSSSANDNRNNNPDDGDDEASSQPIDDSFIDLVLNAREIAGNPSRAAMMQRFLSHLRSNPKDAQLQHFFSVILASPEFSPPRHRLRHVTTIQDAARLLRCSKKILVLTGAGISVSCGIPDFRSKDGLYSRVAKVFPELRDPQSVFDIRLFRRDPRPFFLTAKELYPGQFQPSLSHKFISKMEARGQLLRNYSQNIDTLETIAGIDKVTMCHGSFATATCIRCGHKVSADDIKDKVLAGEIPYCKVCSTEEETSQIKYPLGQQQQQPSVANKRHPSSSSSIDYSQNDNDDDDDEEMYQPEPEIFPLPPVVKPDITFFGEDLPDEFHNNLHKDKPNCDLLLVIGSSLRVRPVSLIPGMVPAEVPQILINRESLSHCRFDVELLGNCDHIIAQLCKMMGSDYLELADGPELREIDKLPKLGNSSAADGTEISEPTSEHDIQALKACWEPKTNEKLVDRLPADTYLSWRQRQYIFDGSEEYYDPDDDEEDDSSSSGSSSSSSCSSSDDQQQQQMINRDREVDEELVRVGVVSSSTTTTSSETSVVPTSTVGVNNDELTIKTKTTLLGGDDKSNH